MFELKNISKQFHGVYALRDVSLSIGGGLHFLIGPSGSGKTIMISPSRWTARPMPWSRAIPSPMPTG